MFDDERPAAANRVEQSLPLVPSNIANICHPCDLKSSPLSNFLLFSLFYSITHATVDAVLVFAAAELGAFVGSVAGATLYICYTVSALVLAKPIVASVGPKLGVTIGLMSLLIYVLCFYLAILIRPVSSFVFIAGASIGGIGAGVLWTAQGSYYSSNASLYAQQENQSISSTTTNFAAIFAAFYLSCEAAFKLLSTGVYLLGSSSAGHWQVVVFGLYTAAAAASVMAFHFLVLPFPSNFKSAAGISISNMRRNSHTQIPTSDDDNTEDLSTISTYYDLFTDQSLAVLRAIRSDRKLCCLLPYQVCFGLTSGFVNTFINGSVVKGGLGEGYIGFLNGISVLTAVLLAAPLACLSNSLLHGNWFIMVFGCLCYSFLGLTVATAPLHLLQRWDVMVVYFVVLGASRGVWENTNKAVIAESFNDVDFRETAYAAIYFSSGLAGAVGFSLALIISMDDFAIMLIAISVCSLIGYHLSTVSNLMDNH